MDQYFAIDLEVDELRRKIDNYFEVMDSLGFSSAIDKSYNYYYGRGDNGTTTGIKASGKQGELSELVVNDYRSFIRYMLTLVASERPAYDVRAVNTDYKSSAQALVGEDVLNYYLKSHKLENKLRSATELALWSSEGFIALEWDINRGEFYTVDPDTEKPVMKGDIKYSTYHAKTCIRDPYDDADDPSWVILIDTINKHELIQQYPEYKTELSGSPSLSSRGGSTSAGRRQRSDTDMVTVYKFYHKKNALLPEGKYAIFIDEEILEQGPLPYEEIPVYRVSPGEVDSYVFGYTPAYDILGLQEANNDLFSALLSNNRAFARQLIAVKRDAGINARTLVEGMSIIELDTEDIGRAIQPIQLTKSAQETYSFLDSIVSRMEKYTGINEVIRGEPSANLRSGNALALVAAQAIKYNATLQQSYNQLLEDVGTATLKFLQQFAAAPRFYTIVGTQNKSLLKEFSSQDIENVDRVEVQRTSALTNTTAGRVELADNLLQSGLIKRPEQYISVLETGKLDPLIESERTGLLNIKSENELLYRGESPAAIITDKHALHIREHASVLDDPEMRKIPEIIQAVNTHLTQHYELWQACPPSLLMATGQEPAPQVQPSPGGGGPPNGDPKGGTNTDALAPSNPGEGPPGEMPNLPGLPDAAGPEDQAAFDQLNLTKP